MGASATLAGSMAYVGTFENEVVAIDMRSRRVLWQYRHPERLFPFYASAGGSQGMGVIGGRDKMVHGLDATTGKPKPGFGNNGQASVILDVVKQRYPEVETAISLGYWTAMRPETRISYSGRPTA